MNEQQIKTHFQSDIWTILEILKKRNIQTEDYYVVLLFMSLSARKVLPVKCQSSGKIFYNELFNSLKGHGEKIHTQFAPIIPQFKDTIENLSQEDLTHIFILITAWCYDHKQDDFFKTFDETLYLISNSQGRLGGEIIQPLELSRILIELADLPVNSSVFNPFAGLASFGVFLGQNQHYYGQEINKKTWAIGQLRLMAYDRIESSQFVCEDSVENWPSPDKSFDLIISHPPFLSFSTAGRNIQTPRIILRNRSFEHFLIEQGIQSLNRNGKLIAVLTQGFLFRGSIEGQLREHLVQEDLIDTIISLPGGILSNTGIPVIILMINLNKVHPGLVRFIDGKDFVETRSRTEKILKYANLNQLVNGPFEDSEHVRIVNLDQIRENNFYLQVPRYFKKSIEGTKLKDLLQSIRGNFANKFLEGQLVKNRDLKDDKIDFNLEVSKIEKSELRTPHIKEINESCLLLATRWKTLKPTWFEYANEPIYLRIGDILPFRIREELVDKAYLISELHSEYVKEQLDSYRIGGSIPMIRKDDLLEVVIKLPSLTEQRAKVQGIEEISTEIKELQKERKAIAHGIAINQFNEFASLKHTLGTPRQNILDWTDNLLDFFSNKPEGFNALNDGFNDFYGTDILYALKEIKRDINFITDVLEKGENGLIIEEFEKTIISLYDINSLIQTLSDNNYKFKIKKLLLEGEKLKERGIYSNKILLKILIDNLLTNANKYGFDRNEVGNEVVFELKELDDFLLVEIRNNGKPFPKNVDREKFITKYFSADSKSSSGLGGYDIHRIASVFDNSDWELVLNQDPIYPVKFKFQFPIKLIN